MSNYRKPPKPKLPLPFSKGTCLFPGPRHPGDERQPIEGHGFVCLAHGGEMLMEHGYDPDDRPEYLLDPPWTKCPTSDCPAWIRPDYTQLKSVYATEATPVRPLCIACTILADKEVAHAR